MDEDEREAEDQKPAENQKAKLVIDENNFYLDQVFNVDSMDVDSDADENERDDDDDMGGASDEDEDYGSGGSRQPDDENHDSDVDCDDLADYLFRFSEMVSKKGVFPKSLLRSYAPDCYDPQEW